MNSGKKKFWLLDQRAGWHTSRNSSGAELTRYISVNSLIRLAADPSGPLSLASTDGSLGGLTLPQRMALDDDGILYLLDSDELLIKKYDPELQRFVQIPAVGGPGLGGRKFSDPTSIAVVGQNLYVADRGNRRVQVFNVNSLALRHVWVNGCADEHAKMRNGEELWDPVDVTAHSGFAYILDHRYGRVYRHLPGSDYLCLMIDNADAANRWCRLIVARDRRFYLLNPEAKYKAALFPFSESMRPCLEYFDSIENGWCRVWDSGQIRDRFDPPPIRLDHRRRFCLPASLQNPCGEQGSGYYPKPETPLELCSPWSKPLSVDSLFLKIQDLKDPNGIVQKLKERRNCLSIYIFSQLSTNTRALLDKHTESHPPSEELKHALIDELNQLIRNDFLYEPERFEQIALSAGTWSLARQKMEGDQLVRLNRILLDEAYAYEIAKSRASTDRGLVFNIRGLQVRPSFGNEPPGPHIYAVSGIWLSQALDSKIHRCQWHRIVLEIEDLPAGTELEVSTYTNDTRISSNQIQSIEKQYWDIGFSITGESQPGSKLLSNKPNNYDFLVQSREGRYLWLKIKLSGDGYSTPALKSIRIYYSNQSYLNYLPAIYADDTEGSWFLERFLSIFQTEWDHLEQEIEEIARYFDPEAVPDGDFLEYLASWLALPLEGEWDWNQKRNLLSAAPKIYPRRGTLDGLRLYLQIYLQNISGLEPKKQRDYPQIVEGYQERDRFLLAHQDSAALGRGALLWGPGAIGRLQLDVFAREGEVKLVSTGDPERDLFHEFAHRFRVYVPAAWFQTAEDERMLHRALNAEKPAHTDFDLCLVEPRFRVGIQSTIGLDTIVADYPKARLACRHPSNNPPSLPLRPRLGYDTILAGRKNCGIQLQPKRGGRVGIDTVMM